MIIDDSTVQEVRNFIDLVKQVRASQKEYFKTRSSEALIKAKQLESKLDAELNDGRRLQI